MLFKIVKDNTIQLITATNYNELTKLIEQKYNISSFKLSFIDEINDEILITCENDFNKICDHYSTQKQNKILKFNLTTFDKHQTSSNNNNSYIIEGSILSTNMENKIRAIVDKLDITSIQSKKPLISLSIGDPTKFDNLKPSQYVINTVKDVLLSTNYNGYAPSFGLPSARQAIAKKYNYNNGINVTENDIFLTCGCSDALNMSICSILNSGDSLLVPKPGFAFYETVLQRYGFKKKFYNLMSDNNWEIDLRHLESQIDDTTKLILVNNPSNPCGSVLSKENLLGLLDIANKYKLPILTDEIYGGMIFPGETFYPLGQLTKTVPIITVGGLSKQYLVPGWRVGWIILYNVNNSLNKVRQSILNLTTLLLGPNTLIQASIDKILFNTPNEYYNDINTKLFNNSIQLYNEFNKLNKYFKPIKPKGAMYVMVKLILDNFDKRINNDVIFCKLLLNEQSVFALPGAIFNCDNYIRCVTCPPVEVMKEVGKRLQEFCMKYDRNNSKAKL